MEQQTTYENKMNHYIALFLKHEHPLLYDLLVHKAKDALLDEKYYKLGELRNGTE